MEPVQWEALFHLLAHSSAALFQVSPSPLENLIGLGVGGAIAGVTIWWKRQDDIRHREEINEIRRECTERVDALRKEYAEFERRWTDERRNLYDTILNRALDALANATAALDENTVAVRGLVDFTRIVERYPPSDNARKP